MISVTIQDAGADMLGNMCENSSEMHEHAEPTRWHPTEWIYTDQQLF